MYRMMYKTQGCGAAFMEDVRDKEEFFRHRELLATGMGFTTELVNDKLYLYDKGKEFGIDYVEEGK